MGYPRKATPELLTRLEEVARQRLQARQTIPSDEQLAKETGFSEKLIQRWMTRIKVSIRTG